MNTYHSFSTDHSLEKLFDTEGVEDCESESDADSVASGPSCRTNTSQDSFSGLEDKSINLNEDFPLPLAESTRSGMLNWFLSIFKILLYYKIVNLRENEMAILRRTKRAMVRAMCGAKLTEKKRTEDQMEMLGLKEQWFRWQRRME